MAVFTRYEAFLQRLAKSDSHLHRYAGLKFAVMPFVLAGVLTVFAFDTVGAKGGILSGVRSALLVALLIAAVWSGYRYVWLLRHVSSEEAL